MEVFQSDSCVLCLDSEPTCYMKPCGHMAYCSECMITAAGRGMLTCPVCRTITKSFHTLKGSADVMDCAAQATVLMVESRDLQDDDDGIPSLEHSRDNSYRDFVRFWNEGAHYNHVRNSYGNLVRNEQEYYARRAGYMTNEEYAHMYNRFN